MIPGRMFGPYITRDIYTTYNSFYCYESTFEIESVKPEDIGTVYVFVSNERGHAGAQITIQLATKLSSELHSSLGKSSPMSAYLPTSGATLTPPPGSRFPLSPSSAATAASGSALLGLLVILNSLLAVRRLASRPNR